METHCELAEVYVTRPSEATAHRLVNRKGYRKTLCEKVELAVALQVHRRKIDGPVFQQSKAIERVARRLDYLGQACIDFTQIESLQQAPEKRFKDYAKLIRRIRKSLALVVINPEDANTRQGLKLGRRATRVLADLQDGLDEERTDTPEDRASQVLHFQLKRMTQILTDIADALLAANFGPAIRLQNYKQLRAAAHSFIPEKGSFGVERLALTRSGSTIAALRAEHDESREVMAVYKEGQVKKVLEEISGVDAWKKVYPKVAPSVISHSVEQEADIGSMVIEHLPGRTLESLLLNSQWDKAGLLLDKLGKTLRKIWKTSWTREYAEPGYMHQLSSRMPETLKTHADLFGQNQTICGLKRPDFAELTLKAQELESRIAVPFCVLIHGDFNVDNLIYHEVQDRLYFIDLHRASYSDYLQDISVLMVSIYRLPIMDRDSRAELMKLIKVLYRFAHRFAKAQKDTGFDARLAIALARSFATSTRFIYDTGFARKLALRACYLLEAVTLTNLERLEKYQLPLEEIFSE